jgi:superfamily I DNA/RNA helicase
VSFGPRVLRITPEISAQVVGTAKRRPGPHNLRRRTVEALLWRALLDQAAPAEDSGGDDGGGADDSVSADELGQAVRRQPEVVAALERMWPLLTPQQLLHDLFGASPLIDLAAGKTFTPEERRLLWRRRSADVNQVRWTDADVPLLDEARALLGPPRRRPSPDGDDQARTYGHVVVDEAQDLTPMQLRMVARRSLSGSMTVVGDIAQATGSWVPASWAQVVEHLPGRRGWRLAELTVNYRTPSEIVEVASRILEQVAPGMRPPEAVRTSGRRPRTIRASAPAGSVPGEALGELAARVVRFELDAFADRGGGGTAAVIVPPSLLDAVGAALDEARLPYGRVGDGALDEQVTMLAIEDAKGLEFDSVVVVEPARIVRETPQGLRALYVAFTRATQRLAIAHSESLPTPVAAAAQSSA